MLNERARKVPGEPVGFLKFLILAGIVFAVVRSLVLGRSPSSEGAFQFAILAYIGYRVARLQPWWPFSEEVSPAAEGASKPGATKRVEPGITHRRFPTTGTWSDQWTKKEAEFAAISAAYMSNPGSPTSHAISSVGLRKKSERARRIRFKTTGRTKRP